MTIKTRSVFYYIDPVTSSNRLMNFIEPTQDNIELTANVEVGGRSIENLTNAIARAMNDAGKLEYTVDFNRTSRLVTISSNDTFNLLVDTGSNAGLSTYSLIGFNGGDRTGSSTYESDAIVGSQYIPQFFLQEYKDDTNNSEGIEAAVNESADGVIEVVTFGFRSFLEFNISFATNKVQSKGSYLDNDPNAIENLNEFLRFCIQKNELEMMKDKNNRDEFVTILLDRTRASGTGTAYELRELISRGLDEYYETGALRFRVL